MHDVGISDENLLVVDCLLSTAHGGVIIAATAGEFTVKESRTHPFLRLAPHSRDYASIPFHNVEGLEIFGVVISSTRVHR